MTASRVIVVGAGIGGLAAALDLAAHGQNVLVLERGLAPGGKMRQVQVGGAMLDAGPTVFTMRWVFDELFERAGTRLADHLQLRPLATLARHAWSVGERLDLHADLAQSADAIGRFAGTHDRLGYLAFCQRARRIYRTLEQPFLRSARPNPLSLAARVGWRGLPDLLRIAPMARLWDALGSHFRDPRLRQLFARYATYCGASPYRAPATLMLVAHVEQSGVWTVDGGMHQVARAVAALAARHGASLRYGAQVDEILVQQGRAAGVRLADGETIPARAVVFNGDVAALGSGLLGPAAAGAAPRTPPQRRSLSALTWNLLAPTRGFPLLHHTVFFCSDYAAEFADIFQRGRLPDDPTVYVCAQDRADESAAPPTGPERLLCLVNAPATGDGRGLSHKEIAQCEALTFQHLARCGLALSPRLHRLTTTPADFERLFPATGGALYGQASHGWMASFTRPGSRSRLPGLYLAGGSTHPGPGVPMAALSGRLAAASLMDDLARARVRPSTLPSPPAATPGGTSMP